MISLLPVSRGVERKRFGREKKGKERGNQAFVALEERGGVESLPFFNDLFPSSLFILFPLSYVALVSWQIEVLKFLKNMTREKTNVHLNKRKRDI
jgi:hypothetical protein